MLLVQWESRDCGNENCAVRGCAMLPPSRTSPPPPWSLQFDNINIPHRIIIIILLCRSVGIDVCPRACAATSHQPTSQPASQQPASADKAMPVRPDRVRRQQVRSKAHWMGVRDCNQRGWRVLHSLLLDGIETTRIIKEDKFQLFRLKTATDMLNMLMMGERQPMGIMHCTKI